MQVIAQKDLKLYTVRIEFNPTVPHCSLATLIGLSIRIKVLRSIIEKVKLDIYIKEGAHTTEEESNILRIFKKKQLYSHEICLQLINKLMTKKELRLQWKIQV